MYIPQKRSIDHKNSIFIICFVVIIFVLALCAIAFFLARYFRQRNFEPKYIPGKFLKRKWKQWGPGGASYGQVPTQATGNADQDTSYRGAGGTGPEMTTTTPNSNSGVQRETSIRSIITLPPYSPNPKPTEQVVAREGERGGMDMVVEFPETAEEQEARREEQMESLYQIRLQRRQELAERESRRQERRDARARGDSVRLEELAAESRARSNRRREASTSNTSLPASTVVADHQARERERRISSVSYAELGHVRHDGSRLRADSHDSDNHPLLQDAAVISSSPSLMDNPSMYSRVQSFASSIMTTDTGATEIDPLALGPTSTRGSSRPLSQTLSHTLSHTDEGDLGATNIPPPPDYEQLDWGEAPAYSSPVTGRHEGLQGLGLTRLPSIHVDAASPIAISPVTPTHPRSQGSEDGQTTPRESARTPSVASAREEAAGENTSVSH
ncbi:uncharacterized protein N7459_005786 [Penicillium hispanicum]|uniref:uncharacterized protein n=1 Tax=Penicillium hispanicum TaxID=1080232 RepID=UPI002542191C|nr:uncharacterized protein N7459_005786 [Penicillium hispanicum]KAJ5579801.1 hypothetical protein N7459_005786 [Penicillium hispanicum]